MPLVKDIDTGVMADPPIRYWTINAPTGMEWCGLAEWPPPGARPDRLYFQGGRSSHRPSLHHATYPDGDFFVYLEGVDEKDESCYMTEGVIRASCRAPAEPPYESCR